MQFKNGFLSYVTDLHSVRAYLCQAVHFGEFPASKVWDPSAFGWYGLVLIKVIKSPQMIQMRNFHRYFVLIKLVFVIRRWERNPVID